MFNLADRDDARVRLAAALRANAETVARFGRQVVEGAIDVFVIADTTPPTMRRSSSVSLRTRSRRGGWCTRMGSSPWRLRRAWLEVSVLDDLDGDPPPYMVARNSDQIPDFNAWHSGRELQRQFDAALAKTECA